MSTLLINKMKGCAFCELPALQVFNERIYAREELLEAIIIEARILHEVTVAEARSHRKHLSNLDIDLSKLAEERDLLDEHSSNLDIVKSRLNRVRLILIEMEESSEMIFSKEYAGLLGQFTKLMELKAKLEGQTLGKTEIHITAEDVIAKLREPENVQR